MSPLTDDKLLLSDINQAIDLLKNGMLGRALIIP
jgi:hypothetical protein